MALSLYKQIGDLTGRLLAPYDGGALLDIPPSPQPPAQPITEPPTPPIPPEDKPYPLDINSLDDSQKAIVTQYSDKNGATLDNLGNVVDKDGNIVVKKEDIQISSPGSDDDYPSGTTITVDDIEYTIDDNGNLIDKDGKIFKEKDDVKEYIKSLESEEDGTLIEDVIKFIGYKVLDENGKEIQYEDSIEGISQYTKDTIERRIAEDKSRTELKFFQDFPEMKTVYNHLKLYGNLNDFKRVTDYSKITFDEANTDQLKQFIRQDLSRKGMDNDTIESFIKYNEDSNKLNEIGKNSYNNLVKAQQDEDMALETARIEKEKQAEQDTINYWNEVKTIIDSKNINGHVIPDIIERTIDGKKVQSTIDDFYNYMSLAKDEDGNAQVDLDTLKLPKEKRLSNFILSSYLMFTGGDYSTLVRMAINKEKVENLKQTLGKTKNRSITIVKPTKGAPVKPDDLLG